MILCVTPNPAIDRTLYVDYLRAGEVNRAEKTLAAAGGKGLNVARTIRILGGDPLCMGLIGGHAGNLLAELAKRDGLPAHWTRMKNETRTCMILVEHGRDATVVNEPGVEIDAGECQLFLADVWKNAARTNLVCVSGSLPPGFSAASFEMLLRGLVERRKSVWVDTSGEALKTALGVRGVNIKVNALEVGEALGVEISNSKQAVDAMRLFSEMGLSRIVITLGREGALLTDATGTWIVRPPEMKIVSTTGSGDAFLGGLVVALEVGAPPEFALRQAVAAAAANTLTFGGGIFSRDEFESISRKLEIVAL
jgi:1-phosphofructokinase family hexose kinase